MYKPRSNPLVLAFFSWYISYILRRDFKQVQFNRPALDPAKAILLLANHSSWWDAFILFYLNRKFTGRKFHVMVTEENYRKVWFFKYLGAFSVKKHSKEVLQSLEFAGQLLNDPKNLVLIFPQGKIYSGHTHEISFEKGLLHLVRTSPGKFQYLFAALFVDHFQYRRPSVTCYLDRWEAEPHTSLQLIKSAYNKHYENSRQQQAQITV